MDLNKILSPFGSYQQPEFIPPLYQIKSATQKSAFFSKPEFEGYSIAECLEKLQQIKSGDFDALQSFGFDTCHHKLKQGDLGDECQLACLLLSPSLTKSEYFEVLDQLFEHRFHHFNLTKRHGTSESLNLLADYHYNNSTRSSLESAFYYDFYTSIPSDKERAIELYIKSLAFIDKAKSQKEPLFWEKKEWLYPLLISALEVKNDTERAQFFRDSYTKWLMNNDISLNLSNTHDIISSKVNIFIKLRELNQEPQRELAIFDFLNQSITHEIESDGDVLNCGLGTAIDVMTPLLGERSMTLRYRYMHKGDDIFFDFSNERIELPVAITSIKDVLPEAAYETLEKNNLLEYLKLNFLRWEDVVAIRNQLGLQTITQEEHIRDERISIENLLNPM